MIMLIFAKRELKQDKFSSFVTSPLAMFITK